MKILLGSHGVGKTTLLKEVQKEYPHYYITDGFSRPVLRFSKKIGLDKEEMQIAINELSTWAYKNYLTHEHLISTRSIIDCIIYSQILCPSIPVKEMVDLLKETVSQIEYCFYIPVEFQLEHDSERLDEVLQIKVDNLLKEFIAEHIPSYKLIEVRGSLEDRLDILKKYL